MRHANTWLILFCGLTALLWAMLLPLWQFPGELNNFAAIQNYAENRNVPSGENISVEIVETRRAVDASLPFSPTRFGFSEQYVNALSFENRTRYAETGAANTPMVSNLLGAFAYEQVLYSSIFDRVFAVRFLSVLIIVFTTFVAGSTAAKLFPDNIYLQPAVTGAVGLSPYLFYKTIGNVNLGLSVLAVTFVLYGIVSIFARLKILPQISGRLGALRVDAPRWITGKTITFIILVLSLAANVYVLYRLLDTHYNLQPVSTFLMEVSQYKPMIAKWPNLVIPLLLWISSFVGGIFRIIRHNRINR